MKCKSQKHEGYTEREKVNAIAKSSGKKQQFQCQETMPKKQCQEKHQQHDPCKKNKEFFRASSCRNKKVNKMKINSKYSKVKNLTDM